jgi:4-carboxymuconolactone decarboxylase
MTPEQEDRFRRLSLSDEDANLEAVIGKSGLIGLDAKLFALLRVAALIATESPLASYQWAIDPALAAGATEEDILNVLTAVAPIVGMARLTSAAPVLALALGFDVERPEDQ